MRRERCATSGAAEGASCKSRSSRILSFRGRNIRGSEHPGVLLGNQGFMT